MQGDEQLVLWKTVAKRPILEMPFLRVENHEVQLPDGRLIPDWLWVVGADAALVLAQKKNGRFLCFRQTKYAVDGETLAPVGGHLEADEAPLAAAQRELLEETGYEAQEWVALGDFVVDPNRFVGRRHLFFARGATLVQEVTSDDLEEQILLELTMEELETAVMAGAFRVGSWTALVALSLQYLARIS